MKYTITSKELLVVGKEFVKIKLWTPAYDIFVNSVALSIIINQVSLMIIQNLKQKLDLKKDYFWIWWSLQMSLWIYIIDEMELGLKSSINKKHKSKEQHWKKKTSLQKCLSNILCTMGEKRRKKKTNQRQLIIAWEKPFLPNQWQKHKQKRNK